MGNIDQKHIATAHYADMFVQICTQEGGTRSTSIHRNVREVAGTVTLNALMNKRGYDNTKSEVV
nr:hypothetical protein [Tanacetum cinerariifolium]